MNSLHLFAGIGGGILADKILGHRIVGAVEIEPYCRAVLKQRQEEGLLEPFPLFDDIRTFKGDEITERIDLICGGFPCQDISTAGKGKGVVKGEKSSLFFELVRVCGAIRPAYIFLENSPAITGRGLGACLNEIARIGYDAEWFTLSAGDCGAPHLRKRWWAVCQRQDTDSDRERELQPERLVEDLRRRFSYLGQEAIKDTDSPRERCEAAMRERLFRYAPGLYCQQSKRTDDRIGDDSEERSGREIANSESARRKGNGTASGIEQAGTVAMATRESGAATASEGIGDDSLSRGTRDSADAASQRRLWETERVGREPFGTVPLVSRSTFSDAGGGGDSPPDGGRETADAASMGRDAGDRSGERGQLYEGRFSAACDSSIGYFPGWWEIEPPLGRVANGIPHRVDRLKGLGNAQVPVCAALAFYLLLRRYCE